MKRGYEYRNEAEFVRSQFIASVIKSWQTCFKNNANESSVSIYSNQQNMTVEVCCYMFPDSIDYVLRIFHETLRSLITKYTKYILVPLRYIGVFKSDYQELYKTLRLCTRDYNIPIDIVWMILERMKITTPLITNDSIRKATQTCIRMSNYFERVYLPNKRNTFPGNNRFLWGDELVEVLFK